MNDCAAEYWDAMGTDRREYVYDDRNLEPEAQIHE